MIKDYSAEWPGKFQKEAKFIQDRLGDLIISIEHIGSTSVVGLSSKPIIDIAVLTKSIQEPSIFTDLLEKIGYVYKPDMSSVERIFLRKGTPVEYHLSITELKYSYWTRQILFRDYLIKHPEALREYAEIKTELAKNVTEAELKDMRSKRYDSGKGPFIQKILQLAQDESIK